MFSINLVRAVVAAAGLSISAGALASISTGAPGGETAGFPCVGKIGHRTGTGPETFDCTGTVVGNGMFVLTARHCLFGIAANPQEAAFQLGATTYYGFDIMYHPTADIAIIKLGTMLSDAYSVTCPTAQNPSNQGVQFCGVGFGMSSSTGITATSTWDTPYGTKRVFYNVIDGPDTGLRGEPTGVYSATVPGGIPGEGIHGPGDSGGPMLVSDGMGGFSVIGVMSYGNNPGTGFNPRPGASAGGPMIDQWVKDRIPTPGSATLFAGSLLILARRRRAA